MKKRAGQIQIGVLLIGAALCVPQLASQASPAAAETQPQPKAMLVDGQPALSLDYGDGMGFLIVYTKFHDKPAFRFSVSHPGKDWKECGGYLWIANNEIAYSPDPTSNPNQCAQGSDSDVAFDRPRPQFTDVRTGDFGDISLTEGSDKKTEGRRPRSEGSGGFRATVVHNVALGKKWVFWRNGAFPPNAFNALDRNELQNAGELMDPWIQAAFNNFPDAENKFLQATAGIPRPLTTEQISTVGSAEKAAEASEQAGNLQAAFDAYVSAVANLPPNATGEQVDSLREHMLRLVPRLSSAPAIPEEAKRHLAFALAAMSDWKTSGDAGKLSEAVDELNKVARLAPWRPEAYFNLGVVLEGQNQYEAAARNYKLYLLAAPNAPDADAVQQKIYQLEYKSGAR
jgi:hypothetical protein